MLKTNLILIFIETQMPGSGIVCVHGGGAGCMIGESMWKQLCREHGVTADGTEDGKIPNNYSSFVFQNLPEGRLKPRALFIDPDAQDMVCIRKGALSHVWSQKSNFVTWNRDTKNLYTEGYYLLYHELHEQVAEKLRRLVEPVDRLEGFLCSRSISGGTGSGLMKRIMSETLTDFSKKSIVELCLFPSKRYSSITIEPYNAVFGITSNQRGYYSILVSNEGVGDYLESAFSKPYSTLPEINSLIARVMCNLTSHGRKSGEGVLDKLIKTAMYPCDAFNLAMPSYSILHQEEISKKVNCKLQLTRNIFQNNTQLVGYPLDKSLGNYLNYQGDISQIESHEMLAAVKSYAKEKLSANTSINAVENCEQTSVFDKGLKPHCELVHVSVNTGVAEVLKDLARKYDKLACKRAFTHWIVQCGLSDELVDEAREQLRQTIEDIYA